MKLNESGPTIVQVCLLWKKIHTNE